MHDEKPNPHVDRRGFLRFATLAGLSAPAAAGAAVPPCAAAGSERDSASPTSTKHKGQCDDTTTKLIDMIITLRDRALQSILTLTLPLRSGTPQVSQNSVSISFTPGSTTTGLALQMRGNRWQGQHRSPTTSFPHPQW